ncbi:MAG: glycosyltransferase family 39 protein [Anaerolineae bacterium]
MNLGWKHWVLLGGIFALAVSVRVMALGGFLTADEPLWIERSRHFAGGLWLPNYQCPPSDRGRDFATTGWGCTLHSEHPGVTTMWGGSLGLLWYYWQYVRPSGIDLPSFLASINPGHLDPALILPVRLPLAIVNSFFIPLFYLLLQRLIKKQAALIAVLLVSLSPFHVALSRVLHHDALTTTFMGLSVLAMIGYWLKGWRWYWLPISAGLAGLACLSKTVGWFTIPFAAVVGWLGVYYRCQNEAKGWHLGWFEIRRLMVEGLVWAAILVVTYAIFFPAIWVIPAEVVRVALQQSVALAEDEHGYYLFGQSYSGDPGPWYYPVGWLLRASPLEVLGLGALVIAVFSRVKGQRFKAVLDNHPVETALLLFCILFLIFVTAAGKKLERYFLPAVPIIDVFVAYGLLWLKDKALKKWKSQNLKLFSGLNLNSWSVPLVILLLQGWFIWQHYPYYSTFYNPLFGGARAATQVLIVSWGEGMEQVGAYLNQQPQAASLKVAVCGTSDLLSPFFRGEAHGCSEQQIVRADYVVFYHRLVQLGKDEDTWPYFSSHYAPVFRVTLAGLDYALVYRNPIEHSAYSVDNNIPNTVTTFGYTLTADGTFKLFWRNLAAGEHQLLVGLAGSQGQTAWVPCTPGPGFETEAALPGAIVESICPLTNAHAAADLYDLQLGLAYDNQITPIDSSSLGLVQLESTGAFNSVEAKTGLNDLAKRDLPPNATPVDISYGDLIACAW